MYRVKIRDGEGPQRNIPATISILSVQTSRVGFHHSGSTRCLGLRLKYVRDKLTPSKD